MDELVGKLTAEQALEIVRRLSKKGGAIGKAIAAEAERLLSEINVDEIAEDVFSTLDAIDIQDLWNRSGRSRDGYADPAEGAAEIVEEELQPFFDQAERYHELGMSESEKLYCMGVILGIYRYEQESQTEFSEWCVDVPGESAYVLLEDWQKRSTSQSARQAMTDFIHQRCPKWSRHLPELSQG